MKRLSHKPLAALVVAFALAFTASGCRQQTGMTQNSSSVAIDHVALNVADLEVSVEFYTNVFGLQEVPAAAAGRRWLSLGKGGVTIHLLVGRTAPVADNRSVHLALTSDDLEPIMERLRDRGISWSDFAGTPGAVGSTRSDGVRQIFFRDPDGYWVEVNDALKIKK